MTNSNGLPKPNTNNEWKGMTPRQTEHDFCLKKHICDRCRSRWAPANQVYCDVCAAKIITSYAERTRRKKGGGSGKKEKNPYMAEIIIAPDFSRGKHFWMIALYSDLGKIIQVRGLHSVDIRDARHGKAKITSFRSPRAEAKQAGKKAALVAV